MEEALPARRVDHCVDWSRPGHIPTARATCQRRPSCVSVDPSLCSSPFSKENVMGNRKPVSVRAYTRRRRGRVEHVRRHTRSYPSR